MKIVPTPKESQKLPPLEKSDSRPVIRNKTINTVIVRYRPDQNLKHFQTWCRPQFEIEFLKSPTSNICFTNRYEFPNRCFANVENRILALFSCGILATGTGWMSWDVHVQIEFPLSNPHRVCEVVVRKYNPEIRSEIQRTHMPSPLSQGGAAARFVC